MFGVYACGLWDLNVILWESPSHNPPLSAWGVWKGVIHFLSPSRSGGLRGFAWIRDLGFGCLARGDGEWADRPRLSLPPSPEHVRANSPVEFTQDYLFPSPRARDTVSFGIDDVLLTAASDSEDFGPSLADALPLSGQEARPSPAYSELVYVLSRVTEKLALDWTRRAPRVSLFETRRAVSWRCKFQN